MDDEDFDQGIKDDILRPASTRSKIVVNLREPIKKYKRRKQFKMKDKVIYDIDKYDKVRMQLLLEDQALYKAYVKLIDTLENNIKYQPRKRRMPIYKHAPALLLEGSILSIFIYVFFLIIQLALFNLVILGILGVLLSKILQFLEAFRERYMFNFRTKDYMKFIEDQNQVFHPLGIDIQTDREGMWIEFILMNDEDMFEQRIAARRQEIFEKKNDVAIQEMKKILNDYTIEKAKEDEEAAAAQALDED